MSESTAAHTTRKSYKSEKRDKPKHSLLLQGTKRKGGAAKDGGGGKGTWGRPGDELTDDGLILSGDPNYSDGDKDPFEAEVPPSHSAHDWQPALTKFSHTLNDFAKFKKTILDAAREYVISLEEKEFINVLREINLGIFNSELTYILFKFSLSYKPTDRESIATLIRHLRTQAILTSKQVAASLHKLYYHIDDLMVDAPNVVALLREFSSLLVAGGAVEKTVVDSLEAMLKQREDITLINEIKGQMDEVIIEFFESVDLDDLIRSIEEWNRPSLHFELIKKILYRSFDRGNRERELVSRLLVELSSDVISRDDIQLAFSILLERVEDIVLDVPDIFRYLSSFLARAVIDEVIPPAFLARGVDLANGDGGWLVIEKAVSLTNESGASQKLARVWADAELEEKKKKNKDTVNSSEEPVKADPQTVN